MAHDCIRCGADARYITSEGMLCETCLTVNTHYTAVKVFSATRSYDRERLGDRVTEWIRTSGVDVVNMIVTQSSDRAFHCISMVVLYREPSGA